MKPKTKSECEEYAVALGIQAKKYNNHVYYHDFVSKLLKELASNLSDRELKDFSAFVDRLATTRAKEEKTGNVNRFIPEIEEEDDSDINLDQYADFM